MRNSLQRSQYESRLAAAHKCLQQAIWRAEQLGDDGAIEDLVALQKHLGQMLSDSTNGKRRPRHQLSIVEN